MITLVKGSDKNIIVRLTDGTTGDPLDLSSCSLIKADFVNDDGTCTDLFYLALTGDTVNSNNTVSNIDTTNVSAGMPISGAGIPPGTTVQAIVGTAGPGGSLTLSQNATATASGVALTLGTVSILSAIIGKIKIAVKAADSVKFQSGVGQSFQVTILNNGVTSIVQFLKSLEIDAGICK